MKYVSTRGDAPRLAFDEVVLAGLARDGGLYVPESWPRLSPANLSAMADLDYPTLAARVMAPFAAPAIDEADLAAIAVDAYRNFDHPEVAPIVPLGDDAWLLELFHGPTLAFKDYALQILGRLFDLVLARRGERVIVIGATSGDTGSSAIEACRDRASIEIFILHPKDRVSEVQRRQMTTVHAANVHNFAIEGTFDDCQDLVKGMFNDTRFRDRLNLAAVNSINWARIAAQVVYYVRAALAVGGSERRVVFSVPTGNFGNVFAGYVARKMGAPIAKFVVASNRNDILTRFFASGRMETRSVIPTLSPSMDIQISSNFERLLFELYDRNGGEIVRLMQGFRSNGRFEIDPERWRRALDTFDAWCVDDDQTKAAIRAVFDDTGYLLDPHSAVGVAAARSRGRERGVPLVAVATAHPAKFPDAVEAATGVRPRLPTHLADLFQRGERFDVLPFDLGVVQEAITETLDRPRVSA